MNAAGSRPRGALLAFGAAAGPRRRRPVGRRCLPQAAGRANASRADRRKV